MLAQAQASGVLLMQHRDAATGDITTTELDHPGTAEEMVALGDGEFLLLTSIGGFAEDWDLYAHHFDGTAWQAMESVGDGYQLMTVSMVGRDDGRAVASWTDSLWGTHERAFDRDTGWADELTANPTNPGGFESWADHRVAIDDEGLFSVWRALFGDGTGRIHTWDVLGPQRARAVWRVDSGGAAQGFSYACHAPVSGWSEPVSITDDYVRRVEARPDGDVLVMGRNADASAWFEHDATK